MKYSKTINELTVLEAEELEQARGAADPAPDYTTRTPYVQAYDQAVAAKQAAWNQAFDRAFHIDVGGVITAWKSYGDAQRDQNWAAQNLNYLDHKADAPPPPPPPPPPHEPDHSEAPPEPPNVSVEPNMSMASGGVGYNGTPIVQVENQANDAKY